MLQCREETALLAGGLFHLRWRFHLQFVTFEGVTQRLLSNRCGAYSWLSRLLHRMLRFCHLDLSSLFEVLVDDALDRFRFILYSSIVHGCSWFKRGGSIESLLPF
jgi:hypothetical protein